MNDFVPHEVGKPQSPWPVSISSVLNANIAASSRFSLGLFQTAVLWQCQQSFLSRFFIKGLSYLPFSQQDMHDRGITRTHKYGYRPSSAWPRKTIPQARWTL